MRKFLSNTKGVAAVEFALTIGLFLFVFFMNFEMTRLAVTSGYLDLGIAQSVRAARNAQAANHDYETTFKNALNSYLGAPEGITMQFLMHKIKPGGLDVKVKYVDCGGVAGSNDQTCISALLNGNFRQPTRAADGTIIAPTGTLATLAYYDIGTYKYEFLTVFPFLPKSWIDNTLNRKFVVLHEYERSSFVPTTRTNP